MPDSNQPDVDRLYSGPRDRFVPDRNTLAKELRELGKKEEAAEVAALRKPNLVAWGLNQAARERPGDVQRLLQVHAEMPEAESAEAMRRAAETRQKIVKDLTDAAVEILENAGHAGEQARDRIGLTLLAVGTNPEAAELLQRGRLAEEVEPGSSWDLSVTPDATDRSPDDGLAAERRQVDRIRKEMLKLEERATKLEIRAEQAARHLEEVRRQAKSAAEEAAEARKEANRKAEEVAAAEGRLQEEEKRR